MLYAIITRAIVDFSHIPNESAQTIDLDELPAIEETACNITNYEFDNSMSRARALLNFLREIILRVKAHEFKPRGD